MARIDPKTIGYMDETTEEWRDGLTSANSWQALQNLGELYADLFPDALEAIRKIWSDDFDAFRAGLKLERKGKFAGEEWAEKWGCILIPELAMQVSNVAAKFHVPWGLAYRRLVEERHINIENGVAVFSNHPSPTPKKENAANE